MNVYSLQKKIILKGFSILFICMLIFPFASKYLHLEREEKNHEKREKTEKPTLSLSKDYAKKYEEYFNDNFGLRNTLVKWSNNIKTNLFRSSPKPEKVKFGDSQFLFYNSLGDKIYSSYSNTNLLNPEKLNKKYNSLVQRKQELNEKGIKFVCTFWPNKHTIYSEYLPFSMSIQKKGTTSFADQLISYCKDRKFSIYDVRENIFNAKKDKQLYQKLDTHWNSDGAFIAYQSFFNQAFSELNIKPYPISAFNIEYKRVVLGDLSYMMVAMDSIKNHTDLFPTYILKDSTKNYVNLSIENYPKRTVITKNEGCGNRTKVLVFRDSYAKFLVQFFSLHFYEVIYIRGGYNKKIVEQVNPNIVISCPVERYLINI